MSPPADAIPIVSAWGTANHVSLGQVVVDEKSNEITAIPKLLEMIAIFGCLVTNDALGCQTVEWDRGGMPRASAIGSQFIRGRTDNGPSTYPGK